MWCFFRVLPSRERERLPGVKVIWNKKKKKSKFSSVYRCFSLFLVSQSFSSSLSFFSLCFSSYRHIMWFPVIHIRKPTPFQKREALKRAIRSICIKMNRDVIWVGVVHRRLVLPYVKFDRDTVANSGAASCNSIAIANACIYWSYNFVGGGLENKVISIRQIKARERESPVSQKQFHHIQHTENLSSGSFGRWTELWSRRCTPDSRTISPRSITIQKKVYKFSLHIRTVRGIVRCGAAQETWR